MPPHQQDTSPGSAGAPRRRRWAPKVRTGCLTCKIRRVKCDEAKPSCSKCLSTGRKCDGYEDEGEKTVGFKHTKATKQQSSAVNFASSATPYCVSWIPFYGGELEKRNFYFFQSVTSSSLAGFYGGEFWAGETLQIAHQYPALFHAITAFGSVHYGYLSDATPADIPRMGKDGDYVQFGLQEYSKSIKSMYKLIAQEELSFRDQQAILTTCLLFTCLSVLQRRQLQAFMHVKSGIRLIKHWRLNNEDIYKENKQAVDMLLLAFTGLDTQIRPYLSGQQAILQWEDDDIIYSSSLDQGPFESLFEAYFDLEVIFNKLLRLYSLINSPEELNRQIQTLVCLTRTWDERFSQLLLTTCLTASEVEALDLIQLRRGWARSIMWPFTTPHLGNNNAEDELSPLWLELIHLAERVLARESSHSAGHQEYKAPPKHPVFALHSTTTEVLYFVTSRCRDPIIRRQALRLIQLNPRREGICEGMAAAKMLQNMIEIEEQGCPRSVGYDYSYSSSLYSPDTFHTSSSSSAPNSSSPFSDTGNGHERSIRPSTTPTHMPCSEKGKWVCEMHRIIDTQYHLLTERQLRMLNWTAEDRLLDRPGREFVVSWW